MSPAFLVLKVMEIYSNMGSAKYWEQHRLLQCRLTFQIQIKNPAMLSYQGLWLTQSNWVFDIRTVMYGKRNFLRMDEIKSSRF